MPDEVIRAPAIQSTPAGYKVPGAQEIIVKSVRALVDGSGAASAFLPTLQLVAPDGSVVWESATDTTVAAGGSADVSWFPGVKSATGGTGPSGSGLAWMYQAAFMSVPYNAGLTSATGFTTQNFFTSTGDTSIFDMVDNGAGKFIPELKAAGLYTLSLYCRSPLIAAMGGKRAYVTFTG